MAKTSDSLTIEDDGTPLSERKKLINFAGAGVTVSDDAGRECTVTIAGGASRTPIIIGLSGGGSGGEDPFFEFTEATYLAVKRFIFPGSTAWATPSAIKVGVEVDAGDSMDIRIWDLTNSLAIATKTGITNTTWAIVDLGTVSNVPTAQALWEIQGRLPGGGENGRLTSVSVLP